MIASFVPSAAFPLHFAIASLAALIFARAAVLKFKSGSAFEGVVDNYDLLPPGLVAPVARGLPAAEAVLALGLAIPTTQQPLAAAGAAGLLLVFALAMAVNLRRGRGHIDCGCGDANSRQPLRTGLVVRNVILAALLLFVAMTSAGAVTFLGAMTGLAAGVGAFMLFLCQDAFAAIPRPSRSAPLPPPDARLGFALHRSAGAVH